MSDLSQVRIPSMRDRVSNIEWQTRVDLAACYRLVHHYRMDDLVYNHISARVPGEEGHFLINAYGMTYDEISASSLVKIDFDGNVVQDSGTGYGINHAGFVIHSAVHRARADVASVIHTHTPSGMAAAALECGPPPLNPKPAVLSPLRASATDTVRRSFCSSSRSITTRITALVNAAWQAWVEARRPSPLISIAVTSRGAVMVVVRWRTRSVKQLISPKQPPGRIVARRMP